MAWRLKIIFDDGTEELDVDVLRLRKKQKLNLKNDLHPELPVEKH